MSTARWIGGDTFCLSTDRYTSLGCASTTLFGDPTPDDRRPRGPPRFFHPLNASLSGMIAMNLHSGPALLSNLLQDILFVLLLLANSLAVSVNAVPTLSLAIGSHTAVFSVVNSVLLR